MADPGQRFCWAGVYACGQMEKTMAEEDYGALQELLDAIGSSKYSYENDVQTMSYNIDILDRTSPITDRYCSSLLNYLGTDTCSDGFDNAMACIRQLM